MAAPRHFRLEQLRPREALTLIAGLGEQARALEPAAAGFLPSRGRTWTPVVLDPGGTATAQRARLAQRLAQGIAALGLAPAEEVVEGPAPDGLLSLPEALPLMLMGSGLEADAQPAEPRAGEMLALLEGGLAPALAASLALGAGHATGLRVMTATDPAGDERVLLHVRDDPERQGAFAPLLVSGALGPAQLLAAFGPADATLFLAPEAAPDAAALTALVQIARAAPRLLGLARPPEGPLLAMLPETGGRRVAWLLDRLEPLDRERLVPVGDGLRAIEIQTLEHSPAAQARLRALLARAAPEIGHALEVRRIPVTAAPSLELEQLRLRIAELEDRAAFLAGRTRSAFRLMRFGPDMLPALAAAIAAFDPSDIDAGHVRYGFHADAADAAGSHYLVFHPETAVMRQDFPEFYWRDMAAAPARPIRFEMDPYWALHYADAAPASAVFVPAGCALFPPLHSWARADMDNYLRQLIQLMAEAAGRREPPPDQPLILAEPDPAAPRRVLLTVLDQGRLAPLSQRLAWINAALSLDSRVEVEKLMRAMGEAATATELAQGVARERRRVEQRLAAIGDEIEAETYGQLLDLTERLSQEIKAAAVRTGHVFAKIDRMYQDSLVINSVLGEVAQAGTPMAERLQRLKHGGAEILMGLEMIAQAISIAEPRLREMEREVEKQFRSLAERQDQLLSLLERRS